MAGLDIYFVKNHTGRKASLSEALANVTPIEWPEEILSGEKKVIVIGIKEEGNACVKLETSYL